MVELLRRLIGRAPKRVRPGTAAAKENLRATQMLHALERAASAIQGRPTRQHLFEAVGGSLAEFGFWTSIMLIDKEDPTRLRLDYISNDSEILQRASAMVGQTQESFRLAIDASPFHREVVTKRATRFAPNGWRVLADVLPQIPQPVLRALTELIGFHGVIGTPLLDGDRALGLMVVSAPDLGSDDQTAVRLFAAHLSSTMRTLRLLEDLESSLTDLELTKSQLLEAQRRETIGLLAGGVAHDFNNLLNAITLSVEIVAESTVDEATQGDLEIIREACDRGSNLVDQLLALGRQAELKIQPFDLDAMLKDLRRLLARVLGEDIRIDSVASDEPKFIEGDRAQLEQVLINLAVNARDAMPDGGSLTIRTAVVDQHDTLTLPPGQYVEITVADNGIGMSEDTRRRAFDPFFTTKGRARGTGLGLSVVRSIVEQHGGAIELTSTLGAGTCFRILLPPTGRRPEVSSEASPAALGMGSGELLLVVEDDRLVRQSCSRVLRRAGYDVRCVADGASARAAVEELGETIELIFCDVILPDERGTRLLMDLIERVPNAVIVVTSGYVDERADRELIAARGWPFLEKPYRHDTLISLVQDLLTIRRFDLSQR